MSVLYVLKHVHFLQLSPPAQRQKEVDQKLRRSGMLLNDPALLAAMEQVEPGGGPRFLPIRVSKRTGAITGDSLATAEHSWLRFCSQHPVSRYLSDHLR